jgi:hypothetical protein
MYQQGLFLNEPRPAKIIQFNGTVPLFSIHVLVRNIQREFLGIHHMEKEKTKKQGVFHSLT